MSWLNTVTDTITSGAGKVWQESQEVASAVTEKTGDIAGEIAGGMDWFDEEQQKEAVKADRQQRERFTGQDQRRLISTPVKETQVGRSDRFDVTNSTQNNQNTSSQSPTHGLFAGLDMTTLLVLGGLAYFLWRY